MNGTLNFLKNHSTQFFFVSGHFYEGGDFLDEGAKNILSPRQIHFALAAVIVYGGGNISAGKRVCKGAISFRVAVHRYAAHGVAWLR